MELKNKTALVIGSTGHLGEAVLTALAEAGCHCICHYHTNKAKAQKIVSNLKNFEIETMAVHANLTESEHIEQLFDKVNKIDKPRILINMAAVFEAKKLFEIDPQDIRRTLDINFTASVLTCQAFVKNLSEEIKSKSLTAKIVNFSSVGGINSWAGYTVYCASKAAVISATKSLAKELAPAICVNAIAPGLISWPENFSEEDRQRQLRFIPLKRAGTEAEIAEAVIFLLKNDYITGQTLCVDGGRTI